MHQWTIVTEKAIPFEIFMGRGGMETKNKNGEGRVCEKCKGGGGGIVPKKSMGDLPQKMKKHWPSAKKKYPGGYNKK